MDRMFVCPHCGAKAKADKLCEPKIVLMKSDTSRKDRSKSYRVKVTASGSAASNLDCEDVAAINERINSIFRIIQAKEENAI